MITQTNGSKMCIWRDSRDFNSDIAQKLKMRVYITLAAPFQKNPIYLITVDNFPHHLQQRTERGVNDIRYLFHSEY